jgi:hypothetical protein
MNRTTSLGIALAALVSCFGAGCGGGGDGGSSGNDEVIYVDSGTLTVDWTVDGLYDPAECTQGGAETIAITVTTLDDAFVDEYTDWCSSFQTSIELEQGTYQASAVLLDAGGLERTTAVDLGVFYILGNDELAMPVNFPADSFY